MNKHPLKSKSIIAGLLLISGAVGAYLAGEYDKAYELFALGLAVIGIRQAID